MAQIQTTATTASMAASIGGGEPEEAEEVVAGLVRCEVPPSPVV